MEGNKCGCENGKPKTIDDYFAKIMSPISVEKSIPKHAKDKIMAYELADMEEKMIHEVFVTLKNMGFITFSDGGNESKFDNYILMADFPIITRKELEELLARCDCSDQG